MIVSDRHRFVFLHIPKCAGSSVRQALARHDETGGRFDRRTGDHPEFGRIDFTHMPLHLLARAEPEIYARLLDPGYAVYAVVRDPFERFPSAVAQRLKMYRSLAMAQADAATLRAEVAHLMDRLRAEPKVIDPAYIHFARQSDYVFHDGRQLAGRLFPVSGIGDLLAEVAGRTGTAPPALAPRANRTHVLRSPALRRPAKLASRAAKRLLPAAWSHSLRRSGREILMKPAERIRPEIFDTDQVRDFIGAHYAEDVALYARVLGGQAAPGP